MKLAIEIEEIIGRINSGKESLFNVIENYEKKLEGYDEGTIAGLEYDIDVRAGEISNCIDEIERLSELLKENKIEYDSRKVTGILRSANIYSSR